MKAMDGQRRGLKVRERHEDATLMASRIEQRAKSQGLLVLSRS